MKYVSLFAVALLLGSVSFAAAEEVKSGLQPGKSAGAFYVTKVAGAEEDGVKVGKELCYRCKNGRNPQVMVFTRSGDEKVVKLISGLDGAIAENSDKSLRAFVNCLSDSKDGASEEAKKLAASTKAKAVPFVAPNEFENGPENYGLNPEAEVTVLVVSGLQVKANHAYSSAKDLDVEKVLADVSKSLE